MLNINELIKTAMKSKNKAELRAYKNLKAEIQILKTAKNAKPYDEAAEIQLISKMCKKLEDAILGFSKAHREDLASEYRDELDVLRKLLPEPVNKGQVQISLHLWSFETNNYEETTEKNSAFAISGGRYIIPKIPKKEMGNAIKYIKSKFPQADGKMISDVVKEYVI